MGATHRGLAAALVSELPSLKHLGLSGNLLGDNGLAAVADALPAPGLLTHLDIGSNAATFSGIASCLCTLDRNSGTAHHPLQTLSIAANRFIPGNGDNLGDGSGVEELARVLPMFRSLTSCNVSCAGPACKVSLDDMRAIFRALAGLRRLKTVKALGIPCIVNAHDADTRQELRALLPFVTVQLDDTHYLAS